MELDKFISETLINIRNGLRAANEAVAESEGKTLGNDIAALFQMGPYEDDGGYIHFDIAVTVSGETTTTGGGGIRIAMVNIGAEASGASKQENVSRIKFSVKPSLYTG
jgi:hypothetical protein